ncbi:neuropeptide-like protein 31 [Mya arenaria]|uniref:neuropeptide-like protein 31 n=1 Tax=Mya arenaria TaxID=6604 RepID=UPI0022E5063D|nr:neuropeptide-like protein 31 [Mya arenaria]
MVKALCVLLIAIVGLSAVQGFIRGYGYGGLYGGYGNGGLYGGYGYGRMYGGYGYPGMYGRGYGGFYGGYGNTGMYGGYGYPGMYGGHLGMQFYRYPSYGYGFGMRRFQKGYPWLHKGKKGYY